MKEVIRKKHNDILENMDDAYRQEASKSILEKIQKNNRVIEAKNVMVYFSVNREVNTEELIKTLIDLGKKIYLPVVTEEKLIAARFKSFDDLESGKYGIPVPNQDTIETISPDELDVVVVPGVCFTKKGIRLGRGGGYYDRFLTTINKDRTHVIGLCYNANIEDDLPKEDTDIGVNEIISENI